MGPTRLATALFALSWILPSTAAAQDAPPDFELGEFRSIDGSGNNAARPDRGRAGVPLLRRTSISYDDGASAPAGPRRPGARKISSVVAAQGFAVPNVRGVSGMLWQWGQFLDHDIDHTGTQDPPEALPIPVPAGDPWFDPGWTGTQTIQFLRSAYSEEAGVRQQINQITAFLDGSQVYGSDPVRAAALRTLDGTGELKTSARRMLPYNLAGLPNAEMPGIPSEEFFLAGDVRCNEQPGLIALHTVFVREHNRLARKIRAARPDLDGDPIYQYARAVVGAEIQAITYREFLPVLLGEPLPPYAGYDPEVDPGIANFFSACAFRVGHTMLPEELMRFDRGGRSVLNGPLPLAEGFFRPDLFEDWRNGGIEALLRGLAQQSAEEVDTRVTGAVRNFLFGPPGAGGFDLASLNIQRGRDHGLPSYNRAREDHGLPPVADFADITRNPDLEARLRALYGRVGRMDAWVGGLAEDHVPGAMVGPLFHAAIREQFLRLRAGDRFWYERYLPAEVREYVERQTLARILRRNTRIEGELAENVFRVPRGWEP